MKLYFFRCEQPNFGDELNLDLMPKVFPDFFDEDDRDLFLAIGSVLFDHHPAEARKIVFGSGYGGYTKPPVLDDKWRVYCVRGPETARKLGLSPDKVAADSAILINRYRPRRTTPGKHVSFMPHWQSIPRGNWEAVCREAGIHFIDPRSPVETVLSELEASSVVLAEAMHGAIVSDALRVPWIPLQPLSAEHRVKWHDWAAALDMDLPVHGLPPSTLLEAIVTTLHRPCWSLSRDKGVLGMCSRVADPLFTRRAVRRLQELARLEPMPRWIAHWTSWKRRRNRSNGILVPRRLRVDAARQRVAHRAGCAIQTLSWNARSLHEDSGHGWCRVHRLCGRQAYHRAYVRRGRHA